MDRDFQDFKEVGEDYDDQGDASSKKKSGANAHKAFACTELHAMYACNEIHEIHLILYYTCTPNKAPILQQNRLRMLTCHA